MSKPGRKTSPQIAHKFGSVVMFMSRPQRNGYAATTLQRAAAFPNHVEEVAARQCRAAVHYLPCRKLSLIEQLAGPRMTTNSVGRMNRISGTVMIAGRRAAFSSARIMRW